MHFSQPLTAIINIPVGGKALLRISDLDVTEYQTLASLGIPMKVIALQRQAAARPGGQQPLLQTNSITLGGRRIARRDPGCQRHNQVSGRQHLLPLHPQSRSPVQRRREFGGLMTEVHICSSVTGGSTFGNTCNNSN